MNSIVSKTSPKGRGIMPFGHVFSDQRPKPGSQQENSKKGLRKIKTGSSYLSINQSLPIEASPGMLLAKLTLSQRGIWKRSGSSCWTVSRHLPDKTLIRYVSHESWIRPARSEFTCFKRCNGVLIYELDERILHRPLLILGII